MVLEQVAEQPDLILALPHFPVVGDPIPTGHLARYWYGLEDFSEQPVLQAEAQVIREGIMPNGQVALRKTFGLNEPGCTVNCGYCTLGSKFTNTSNRGLIKDNLEADIEAQLAHLPPETQVELVGYWHGIGDPSSDTFQTLTNIVGRLSETHTVGADVGIVSNPVVIDGLTSAGLAYLHNNLETTPRLYESGVGINAKRYDRKVETLELAHQQGLTTTTGLLIGIGEAPEDIIAMAEQFRRMPATRIVVNFMDYDTNKEIGARYANVKDRLTPEYALRVLTFLRLAIRHDQSLMVGSGVGKYLYGDALAEALKLVDTLHIGSFINLNSPANLLLDDLQALNYEIAHPQMMVQ